MLRRGCDILNDASDDRVDGAAVSVRVELCAKCAYDCADPASDPPDTLDRGEDALSEIDGREESKRDVSVAAALMSMSTSAALSSESCTACLPFPFAPSLLLRLLDFAGAPSDGRDDLVTLR